MSLYRIWMGTLDMVTADEKPARMWLAYHEQNYPNEPAHIEAVADDAPTFLEPETDDDPAR